MKGRGKEQGESSSFVEAAAAMEERLVTWRSGHREASFDEIAEAVGQERRVLMGQLLEELAGQAQREVEALETACPACEEATESKGQKERRVSHREGEVRLKRGYRYCAGCGRGFFPPRPAVAVGQAGVESGDGAASGAAGGGDCLV